MIEPRQKSSGAQRSAALLVLAFTFSPAVLIVSRPFGFVSVSALASGAACLVVAWVAWKTYSLLNIPSPEISYARSKKMSQPAAPSSDPPCTFLQHG